MRRFTFKYIFAIENFKPITLLLITLLHGLQPLNVIQDNISDNRGILH